jgi:hypothetical protein
MWSIRTRKCSAVTRSAAERGPGRALRNELGQGILEYVLVLAVVIGIFLVLAKPYMAKFNKQYEKLFKGGVFAEDSTGSKFYYFPVR